MGHRILDGGPELKANDALTVPANHEYGFRCGEEGMRFITIRTGQADVRLTT